MKAKIVTTALVVLLILGFMQELARADTTGWMSVTVWMKGNELVEFMKADDDGYHGYVVGVRWP